MKVSIVICLVCALASNALACTKEELIAQIDMVTKALETAAPQIKAAHDNFGSSMPANMKAAIKKCHDDMLKFKAAKEDIKKKVNAGTMSVDDGCSKAQELTKKFADDMKAMVAAMGKGGK